MKFSLEFEKKTNFYYPNTFVFELIPIIDVLLYFYFINTKHIFLYYIKSLSEGNLLQNVILMKCKGYSFGLISYFSRINFTLIR